jgi:natural resistance-associated macrophage protein
MHEIKSHFIFFSTAFYSEIEQVTKMNDYLNAIMALQLPFATIPTVAFSSSVGKHENDFNYFLI